MKAPHLDHEFEEEIASLRALLNSMSKEAYDTLAESLQALENLDVEQARRIGASDEKLNRLELEIDERCLKILARRSRWPRTCGSSPRP